MNLISISSPMKMLAFLNPVLILLCAIPGYLTAADPLPSWNDGPAKTAIIEFVESLTMDGSPKFIEEADRIATFDNDGCLWCENPMPFQLAYTMDAVKEKVAANPKLKDDPMVQAGLKGDFGTLLADGTRGCCSSQRSRTRE
ncbi:hypothetical protein [Novipirellula artificiosorum]|uniref:Uncharacterized protein n=1 Tax=Novipirellula artificiosorum TaxID=2528016 RepID=A0A5C6CSW3_9BACT|nr:hypothetical protein [Novipirellula artificiosorum]TWU28033.1 hypothetical protein Poly41_69290 [Novipirellula artificiosorum]